MAAGEDLGAVFDRLRRAAEGLPEVEEGISYGTPSLKVRKKFLCRVKDADTAVVTCPLEEKEMLISDAPEIFFETDHYKGWPAILVRISHVSDEELRNRMRIAWRMQAPKRLVTGLERGR